MVGGARGAAGFFLLIQAGLSRLFGPATGP